MSSIADWCYEHEVPLDESARLITKWLEIVSEADQIMCDCFTSMGLTDGEVDLLMKAHNNVCSARRVLTSLELRHRRLTND